MTDLWREASRDVEAENRAYGLEMAKSASSGTWTFLALAQSRQEFADRVALASSTITRTAGEHGVAPEDLLKVFTERFALLMEAGENPFAKKDDDQDDSDDSDDDSKDDGDSDSDDDKHGDGRSDSEGDDDGDEQDSDKDDSDVDDAGTDDSDDNGDDGDDDHEQDDDGKDNADDDEHGNDKDDDQDEDLDNRESPAFGGIYSSLLARINAGEDPLAWGGAAPFAGSLGRTAVGAEVGDIARAVDKFQEERHPDGVNPDWGPLHKALPADEHDAWMYMGKTGDGPFAVHHYKHGITREPLHLDPEGNSGRDLGNGRTGWGEAKKHLTDRGHYDMLKQMGATPQTKYDQEYQRGRNQRLQDAGYSVVQGSAGSMPPVSDSNVPTPPDPMGGMDGATNTSLTTKPRQTPGGDQGLSTPPADLDVDPAMNGGDIEAGQDSAPDAVTAKLNAIAADVRRANPQLSVLRAHAVAVQVVSRYLVTAEDVSPLLFGDRGNVGDGPLTDAVKNWSPTMGPKPQQSKPGDNGDDGDDEGGEGGGAGGAADGAGEAAAAGEGAAGAEGAADLLPLLAL
jgi:hypothetical protein